MFFMIMKLKHFLIIPFLKDNVRIKEHGMITSAIKKQTFVCCSISLNPYMAFQTWNHG